MGRKTGTKMIINNGSEVQTDSLEYNELGQLKTKRLHVNNDAGLEAINYAYNPRGWLTKTEGNYFSFKLHYDNAISGSTAQYNGNISSQEWGLGSSYSNNFKYSYDNMNRLLSGISTLKNNETNISYDKVGNLLTLQRDNTMQTYFYQANRLNIFNNGQLRNYTYNAEGSMINDGVVQVAYNELNLPNRITTQNIDNFYTYDAMGNKLRRNFTLQNSTLPASIDYDTTRYYVDGMEFVGSTPCLDVVMFSEGYIDSSLQTYNYFLKDHLGNTRKVISKNINTNTANTSLQSTNYYPFGKAMISGNTKNKYLYNGKELQAYSGYYDYGARMYNSEVGRWFGVDPLGEKFVGLSSYVYCANNPILIFDPDGRDWSFDVNKDKKGNWHVNINFTGSILNSSVEKFSKQELNDFAKAVSSQFEAAFSQTFKNEDGSKTIVNATANIDVINDKSNLADNSTLLEIRNQDDDAFKTDNQNEKIVASAENGKLVLFNASSVNDLYNGNNNKTIAHEIGHTGGLRHPKEDKENLTPTIFPFVPARYTNFMNQNIDFKTPKDAKKFTGVTKGQIQRIYNLYSNGFLNNQQAKHPIYINTPNSKIKF